MDGAPAPQPDLVWEIDVPLINNRVVMGGTVRAFGIAALLVAALMTLIFATQGEWEALGAILLAFAAIFAGIMVIALVSMAVVFRNKMRFRFTLSDEGVLMETIDKTARAVNRLATVAGTVGGSASTAGAGLIATSQETQGVLWEGAFRAQFRPRSRVIVLRNAWRQLLVVYCTTENYGAVAARVAASMQAHGTAQRVARRSPVPRYIGWSLLAALACLPLFPLADEFGTPLWIPIGILCFAEATIWLVGVFGYVVLLGLLATAWTVIADALSMRESFFEPGATYRAVSVYGDTEWSLIIVAAIGAALLTWIALRAVTGRMPSMLAADTEDMTG